MVASIDRDPNRPARRLAITKEIAADARNAARMFRALINTGTFSESQATQIVSGWMGRARWSLPHVVDEEDLSDD